jgi:DNA-binding transcriptional ArsR family regulator
MAVREVRKFEEAFYGIITRQSGCRHAGLWRVTRLRILNLLYVEHELCVYDMVGVIGASQPKISRHLAYLRRAGLVSYRKDGLWVYYRLGFSGGEREWNSARRP